eukprot:1083977-Rhodomonas_salina.1
MYCRHKSVKRPRKLSLPDPLCRRRTDPVHPIAKMASKALAGQRVDKTVPGSTSRPSVEMHCSKTHTVFCTMARSSRVEIIASSNHHRWHDPTTQPRHQSLPGSLGPAPSLIRLLPDANLNPRGSLPPQPLVGRLLAL